MRKQTNPFKQEHTKNTRQEEKKQGNKKYTRKKMQPRTRKEARDQRTQVEIKF